MLVTMDTTAQATQMAAPLHVLRELTLPTTERHDQDVIQRMLAIMLVVVMVVVLVPLRKPHVLRDITLPAVHSLVPAPVRATMLAVIMAVAKEGHRNHSVVQVIMLVEMLNHVLFVIMVIIVLDPQMAAPLHVQQEDTLLMMV
jgi:hypothetical protein